MNPDVLKAAERSAGMKKARRAFRAQVRKITKAETQKAFGEYSLVQSSTAQFSERGRRTGMLQDDYT
jgi:hypothetical protein